MPLKRYPGPETDGRRKRSMGYGTNLLRFVKYYFVNRMKSYSPNDNRASEEKKGNLNPSPAYEKTGSTEHNDYRIQGDEEQRKVVRKEQENTGQKPDEQPEGTVS